MLGAPWTSDAIKSLLDTMQRELFGELKDPDHRHRVTLFCHRHRLRWFHLRSQQGWLVPVARSGHLTAKTTTCFRATDEPSDSQGIAGQAWLGSSLVFVPDSENEPLPVIEPNSRPKDRKKYAENTFVSVEWVDAQLAKRPETLPRSFFAGRVEDAEGRPWGVLVIDSAQERLDEDRIERAFWLLVPTLSILVKGRR